MSLRSSRSKGNEREDAVQAMLAERGRYAVVLRGSGSRGTVQQKVPCRVAGDILVTPVPVPALTKALLAEMLSRVGDSEFRMRAPGIQIEVGGRGKSALKELADLRDGAIPGYALAVVIFGGRGESMKPKRWLLADDDGGYTECDGLDDLLATIEARA